MSDKDTGGPAFPAFEEIDDTGGPAFPAFEEIEQWDKDSEKYRDVLVPTGGMTLRDWFAGKAMVGALSNFDVFDAVTKVGREDGIERIKAIAIFAYDLADAMLAERAK